MSDNPANAEIVIQEYNKRYRKLQGWKSNSDDLLRYCKVKPYKLGFKNVYIGTHKSYCEFKYRIVHDRLEVSFFQSKTIYQNELRDDFSDEKARTGIDYILGLARQLGTSAIIIELLYIPLEDQEIFREYNFSFRPNKLTGGAIFTHSLK